MIPPRFNLEAQVALLGEDSLLPPDPPPRPYKPKDQPEHRFSHWVMVLFERVILEPCYFTAVDHSGEPIGGDPAKNMRWREKQKAMGIKPSQLDWQAVQFTDIGEDEPIWPVRAICWVELKRGKNKLSDGQIATIRMFRQRHQVADEARTPTRCLELLRQARFQLHANAGNIAAEIEERLAAADRAAPDKLAAKAKRAAAKPRQQRSRNSRRLRGAQLLGGLAKL